MSKQSQSANTLKNHNLSTQFQPLKIITRRPNGTKSVKTINNEPTMTKQEFKKECDVNEIMKKYKATGSITHVNNGKTGVYADLSNIPDLMEAKAIVAQAETAFSQLPASLRERFQHDPQKLIEYISNPQNDEESIKLGLRVRAKPTDTSQIVDSINNLNNSLKPKPSKKSQNDEE